MELTLKYPSLEERNGGLYISGKRVSLDSIIHEYKNGRPPESIIRSFPVLDLVDVYGAIAIYLANREAIEAYLAETDRIAERMLQESNERNRERIEAIWGDSP